MNNLNYIKIIFFCLTIASCSSKKNIIYIQDYDLDDVVEYEYIDYKLDVDDIIKISLKIESPESSIIANSGFNNV